MVKIKIDNKEVFANPDETILQVATREGVYIPTLCYLKDSNPTSNCRICLVEVKGQKNLVTACSFKVYEGMEILTQSEEVEKARKINLELILSNHNYDCDNCVKQGCCELETLAKKYNVSGEYFKGEKLQTQIDSSSACIVRDNSKCILCKKCVEVCKTRQQVNAIGETNRGFNTKIECAFNKGLGQSSCVGCGQCVLVCPTGALYENFNIQQFEDILKDKSRLKVVAPAPAVRTALLEELGFDAKATENLIPAIFKKLGFDKVFDTNTGADLTIMEESAEFLNRLKTNKNFPMFTSCCPAWVDYVDKFYPEFKNNVSSCKSPLMMFGSVVKTYYAEKVDIPADKIAVASVMPCTAKKGEKIKVGNQDVDCVITVRELLYIIAKHKIDVNKLKPIPFDSVLGESSGASIIFGASGGVMEATIRTLVDKLGLTDVKIVFKQSSSIKGARFASVNLLDKELNLAVVSGLSNAKQLLEKIKKGELNLHFIEVMACEGGCVNGGGMPVSKNKNVIKNRTSGLAEIDKSRNKRKSHENKEVQEFLKWQSNAKNKAKLHTR